MDNHGANVKIVPAKLTLNRVSFCRASEWWGVVCLGRLFTFRTETVWRRRAAEWQLRARVRARALSPFSNLYGLLVEIYF